MNGVELKKLRTEAGMTQSELAEGLGYFSKGKPNRSIVARWENNHQSINSRIEGWMWHPERYKKFKSFDINLFKKFFK